MNIAQAKQQICNAMQAYFARDAYGGFCIPPETQRPVFLVGPPGIGKTAIMKQVAAELGVGLVSYSMTHHTRQSALGLPVIVNKKYGGESYQVSEYTMSEIIAAVYDAMENGAKEGILFLDEINCVSETLHPTMLQFLQYKTFGRHKVPEGWIIVTAGNPPEYNRSARDFDIAIWDRLKRIDIEPDFPAWKAYAVQHGVHPAVLTYLDARKEHFYRVETTIDGKKFVTARGWEDLSNMMTFCEDHDITVDHELIGQYLQDHEISEDFATYYELFNKYKSDYQVEAILSGTVGEEIFSRAKQAPFDERLSLLGLLLSNVGGDMRSVVETEDTVTALLALLKEVKAGATVARQLEKTESEMERTARRGALTPAAASRYRRIMAFLQRQQREQADFAAIKSAFDGEVAAMRQAAAKAGDRLHQLFAFAESVWPDGQELLILVTDLTANPTAARFIARYGCDDYYHHNKELMFYQRQTEIIKQLEKLETEL